MRPIVAEMKDSGSESRAMPVIVSTVLMADTVDVITVRLMRGVTANLRFNEIVVLIPSYLFGVIDRKPAVIPRSPNK